MLQRTTYSMMFVLGVTSSLAATAATLSETQKLAERFSPVIVNEERYSNKAGLHGENQLDRVDKLFYDVSETEDYIFISYSVMKSWSANPTPLFRFWKIGDQFMHPVDSEDLSLVIRKDRRDGSLHPVLYTTNRHGERLVYAVEDELDPTEFKRVSDKTATTEIDPSWTGFLSHGAGNVFGASQAIEKTFDGKLAKANFVGGHPVIGSSYTTHSLERSSLSKGTLADDKMVVYVSNYASDAAKSVVEAGFADKPFNKDDKAANSGDRLKQYELLAYSDLIPDMVGYVKADNRLADLKHCKVRPNENQFTQVTINGQARTFDAAMLPSHFDYEWYFERFRPNMLEWYRTNEQKLKSQRADLFYSGHDGIVKTGGLCGRLTPAEALCKDLPETCKKHGVDPTKTPNYLRYDLIEKSFGEVETTLGLKPAPASVTK